MNHGKPWQIPGAVDTPSTAEAQHQATRSILPLLILPTQRVPKNYQVTLDSPFWLALTPLRIGKPHRLRDCGQHQLPPRAARHVRVENASNCIARYNTSSLERVIGLASSYRIPQHGRYPTAPRSIKPDFFSKTRGRGGVRVHTDSEICGFARITTRFISINASLGVYTIPVGEKPAFRFV